MPWLEREYPGLVRDYRRMYRGANAPRAVTEAIGERVRAAKRHHPAFGSRPGPASARRLPEPPPPPAEAEPATQLSLGL